MTVSAALIGTLIGLGLAWAIVQVVLCAESLLRGNCPQGSERNHLIGAVSANAVVAASGAWLVWTFAPSEVGTVALVVGAALGLSASATKHLPAPVARR